MEEFPYLLNKNPVTYITEGRVLRCKNGTRWVVLNSISNLFLSFPVFWILSRDAFCLRTEKSVNHITANSGNITYQHDKEVNFVRWSCRCIQLGISAGMSEYKDLLMGWGWTCCQQSFKPIYFPNSWITVRKKTLT